jgi:hypothetical protein
MVFLIFVNGRGKTFLNRLRKRAALAIDCFLQNSTLVFLMLNMLYYYKINYRITPVKRIQLGGVLVKGREAPSP